MTVADLADPHGLHPADALPRLRRLALYADTHAGTFGHFESVIEAYGKLRLLDLKNPEVRRAIRDSEDAVSLFE